MLYKDYTFSKNMRKEKKIPEPNPLFLERMQEIFNSEKDYKEYLEILKHKPSKSIRCNTLKVSPEKLKKKLESYGWKLVQPWEEYPEVMVIDCELEPGELGRSLEHLLGYYYIQELASMLPIIALKPKENDVILDLCAAPGSKTTQAAAEAKNTGLIIANELSMGRIKILASNLERCGVTNTIITKKEGAALSKRFKKQNLKFDKILVDAHCSGEGTLRSKYKTHGMWNIKTIMSLPRIQKSLFLESFKILKVGGEIIYSTCTHAPEENESVVSAILNELGDRIKIEKIKIPVTTRKGLTKWKNDEYNKGVELACRVYPQDNDTDGFFLSKFTKLK